MELLHGFGMEDAPGNLAAGELGELAGPSCAASSGTSRRTWPDRNRMTPTGPHSSADIDRARIGSPRGGSRGGGAVRGTGYGAGDHHLGPVGEPLEGQGGLGRAPDQAHEVCGQGQGGQEDRTDDDLAQLEAETPRMSHPLALRGTRLDRRPGAAGMSGPTSPIASHPSLIAAACKSIVPRTWASSSRCCIGVPMPGTDRAPRTPPSKTYPASLRGCGSESRFA